MDYFDITTAHDSPVRVSTIALGAMTFGTTVDEPTSFAILDRYVERGGTFLDTANNYAYWIHGSRGGESELLLGRWLASRGLTNEVVVATKVGGRPTHASSAMSREVEGLSPETIRSAVLESLTNLGRETVDLYYAHIPDTAVPLQHQVATFGELARDGRIRAWGLSNHWSWQVQQAQSTADAAGLPRCASLQYHFSYLRPRTDRPSLRSPDGQIGVAGPDLLSYVRAHPTVPLVAYSALLGGAYVRSDKPLDDLYNHSGNDARRRVLADVVTQTGATPNQVVLSWMSQGELPIIPLIGASSVAQLDELLDAADLVLTADQRAELDEAN